MVPATSPVSSFLSPIIELSSGLLSTILNSIFWLLAIFLPPGLPCKAQLSPAPIGRVCPGRLLLLLAGSLSTLEHPPTAVNQCPRGQDLPILRARCCLARRGRRIERCWCSFWCWAALALVPAAAGWRKNICPSTGDQRLLPAVPKLFGQNIVCKKTLDQST